MANFARVNVGALEDIDKSEAFQKDGLNKGKVAAAVKDAEGKNYAYFIIAYFKIPKEIKDEDIKGKKKPVSEVEAIFAESESSVMKKVKLFFQHDRPELNDKAKKDDALKDDVIQAIIGKWTRSKPSADEVKAQVEKYFENLKVQTPGMTWKGTPGYEGFNETNMKEAFKAALPEGGELLDFGNYKPIEASSKFCYYNTKIPADADVYLAFTNELAGMEPPRPPEDDKQAYFVVMKDLDKDPPGDDLKSKDKIRLKYLNDEKPLKPDEVTDDVLERLKQEALGKLTDDEKAKYDFDVWVKDPKKPDEWEAGNGVKPDSDDPATIIYAKFKKKGEGSEKEVYFAVADSLDKPDPKKIRAFLNGKKPVKVPTELTDDKLDALEQEAESIAETVRVKESIEVEAWKGALLESELVNEVGFGGEDVGSDDDDEEDSLSDWEFDGWVPDPKDPNGLSVNGKTPDGKGDAIIVCAKFRKVGEAVTTDYEPEDEEGGDEQGDDLYIVPMPGVKIRNEDSDGFEK